VADLEEDDAAVRFGKEKAWRPILLYCDGRTGPSNTSTRAFRSSASISLHKSDLGP
jgi:hypothetical protein